MFRLLKGLGRRLSGLSTAGVAGWLVYPVRARFAGFSTDVPGSVTGARRAAAARRAWGRAPWPCVHI